MLLFTSTAPLDPIKFVETFIFSCYAKQMTLTWTPKTCYNATFPLRNDCMFVSISTAVSARLLLKGSHGTTGGWIGNRKKGKCRSDRYVVYFDRKHAVIDLWPCLPGVDVKEYLDNPLARNTSNLNVLLFHIAKSLLALYVGQITQESEEFTQAHMLTCNSC